MPKVQSTHGVSGTAATSRALAYGSNLTAGNLCIVMITFESATATISSVIDTLSQTWVAIGSLIRDGNNTASQMYYAKNCAGGANTVTVNFSALVVNGMAIFEFSGQDTVAPLRGHAEATGTAVNPSSGNLDVAPVTNDLLVGSCTHNQNGVTAGSGYTLEEYNFDWNGTAQGEDKSASGETAVIFTQGVTGVWGVCGAAFKPAGGGGGGGGGITDRVVRTLPTLPVLGNANFKFVDPTFGSRMARVTDPNYVVDLFGVSGRSFRAPAVGRGWNADNTKFFITHGDGNCFVVTFDSLTLNTARYGGQPPYSNANSVWHDSNPNRLYGVGLYQNPTIIYVDMTILPFAKATAPIVIDLTTIKPNLVTPDQTYIGSLGIGNDHLCASFGGTGQEFHHYELWLPLSNPAGLKVIDTMTLNGMDASNSHFHIHNSGIDLSGRYIQLIPSTLDNNVPVGNFPLRSYIWDTTLDIVTGGLAPGWGGHGSLGWGRDITLDVLTTYDSTQWVFTPDLLNSNTGRQELVSPLISPIEQYAADHSSWNNDKQSAAQPFVSGIYRVYDGPNNVDPKNTCPWRPWDGEIVTVQPVVGGTVTRYCHHRSPIYPEIGVAPFDYWYSPTPNISNDGKYAIFTSNWDKSLGADVFEGNKRQDVFVVELSSAPGNTHRRHGHFAR